jgi:dephospho-CoA kinase
MLVAGLTGNYGMGKSSVSAMFRRLGAETINSDEIVAGILKEKKIIARIGRILGREVVNEDGSLNKQAVAGKVFSNSTARKEIEALLHPSVLERVDISIREIRDKKDIVIVEVPLLFEGRFQSRFDRTVTVHASRKTVLARLSREGISRKDALSRLRAQMDIRHKKRLADYCIDNNGTRAQTAAQVKKTYQLLIEENRKRISTGQHRS